MSRFDMEDSLYPTFGKYTEAIKKDADNTPFEFLEEVNVSFDAARLQITDVTDLNVIVLEQANIARSMFIYGSVLESQSKALQKLEEEFSMWEVSKYKTIGNDKAFKSEAAKNKYLMDVYGTEYTTYNDKIRNEKYKLGLLSRTMDALKTYSIKLDAIQRALETLMRNV